MTTNNLKGVNLKLPLGTMTCITGVSGSGKSSLILETLYKALNREINGSREPAGFYKTLKGAENIDKIIDIDQSPIGRTPRSNPATYTGLFTYIRDWFAGLPESKARGYSAGRFSFNVAGGRCEACKGDGVIKIEMNFLSDVYVKCDVCKGKRYNRETLEVKYKGKTISDVLDMSVKEALEFFDSIPAIKNKLQTLNEILAKYNLTLEQTAYMGDDLPDICILEKAGLSGCPNDAVKEVKNNSRFISSQNGGRGAVREFCEFILKYQTNN